MIVFHVTTCGKYWEFTGLSGGSAAGRATRALTGSLRYGVSVNPINAAKSSTDTRAAHSSDLDGKRLCQITNCGHSLCSARSHCASAAMASKQERDHNHCNSGAKRLYVDHKVVVFFGSGASPARVDYDILSSKFSCHMPEQESDASDACRFCRAPQLRHDIA